MTTYEELYAPVLTRIKDLSLALMDEDLGEQELLVLLNAAILDFQYCKVDLTDKDDEEKRFNNTLNFYEKEILIALMVKEWATNALFDMEKLDMSFHTNDVKGFSPASLIRTITSTIQYLDKKITRRKQIYTTKGRWGEMRED